MIPYVIVRAWSCNIFSTLKLSEELNPSVIPFVISSGMVM